MTNQGYTHILAIIDRSGSMEKMKDEAQSGFNAFIKDQAQEPGTCRVTVVQFDHWYEVVHPDVAAAEMPPFALVPRGSTALYDAIGRGVVELGEVLAAKPEEARPERVVVVIVTDGEENSSNDWKDPNKVAALIKQQQEQWGWTFTYIGANQNAILSAQAIGIAAGSALTYDATGDGVGVAFAAASAATTRSRSGGSFAYTEAERQAASKDAE